MACGGFTCAKNALISLNVLYLLVACILIGVASWSRATAVITWVSLIGVVIACGVFLFFIAILGLIGAVKHHQVSLFFYMVILFVIFLFQFAIACAILAVNKDQQYKLVSNGWRQAGRHAKTEMMHMFDCCGFEDQDLGPEEPMGHPWCQNITVTKCQGSNATCCTGVVASANESVVACPAPACYRRAEAHLDASTTLVGGVGLFFSFTEIIGVILAFRYRNLKDPRANPNAFL